MQRHDTLIITNVYSNTISLIDAEDPRIKVNLPVGGNPHEAAVSPNGRFALVANYGDLSGKNPGNTLTSIDIENQKVLETIQLPAGSRPHGLAFISNQLALVTAQGINALLVVQMDDDFKNGKLANIIHLPSEGAHMVTVTKDAKSAYIGCFSGDVCRVHIEDPFSNNCVVERVAIGRQAAGLALTPDEKRLFVTNMKDNYVAVVNTADMTVAARIKTRSGPTRVLSCDEGKSMLVIDSIGGKSEIIDVAALTVSRAFDTTNTSSYKTGRFAGGFFGLLPVPVNAVVKDDQTAYVTNLYAGNVSHINLRDGVIMENFEADVSPDGIAMSSVSMRRQ